jgi:hypothetical protein
MTDYDPNNITTRLNALRFALNAQHMSPQDVCTITGCDLNALLHGQPHDAKVNGSAYQQGMTCGSIFYGNLQTGRAQFGVTDFWIGVIAGVMTLFPGKTLDVPIIEDCAECAEVIEEMKEVFTRNSSILRTTALCLVFGPEYKTIHQIAQAIDCNENDLLYGQITTEKDKVYFEQGQVALNTHYPERMAELRTSLIPFIKGYWQWYLGLADAIATKNNRKLLHELPDTITRLEAIKGAIRQPNATPDELMTATGCCFLGLIEKTSEFDEEERSFDFTVGFSLARDMPTWKLPEILKHQDFQGREYFWIGIAEGYAKKHGKKLNQYLLPE